MGQREEARKSLKEMVTILSSEFLGTVWSIIQENKLFGATSEYKRDWDLALID